MLGPVTLARHEPVSETTTGPDWHHSGVTPPQIGIISRPFTVCTLPSWHVAWVMWPRVTFLTALAHRDLSAFLSPAVSLFLADISPRGTSRSAPLTTVFVGSRSSRELPSADQTNS